MMNGLKHTFIFSLALLTACTSQKVIQTADSSIGGPTPQLTTTEEETISTQNLNASTNASKISSWVISGAMAARNQKKGWSASLVWEQQGPSQYHIRLFGPLGGGTILIDRSGGMVTYTDGPKKASSSSADELLFKQTGVRLPVQNLYYWVRGLPAPGAIQASQYDNAHRLTSLMQAGYAINYSNYSNIGNIHLPGKIALQGHGVVIKLIIKRWKI